MQKEKSKRESDREKRREVENIKKRKKDNTFGGVYLACIFVFQRCSSEEDAISRFCDLYLEKTGIELKLKYYKKQSFSLNK